MPCWPSIPNCGSGSPLRREVKVAPVSAMTGATCVPPKARWTHHPNGATVSVETTLAVRLDRV